MKLSTVLVWLLTLQICCGASPRLFQQDAFTAASIAEAVNYFVGLGEAVAVQELRGLALDHSKDFADHRGEWSVNERIGWVCRVLFEPRTNGFLHPPAFGALSKLPDRTMPLSSWPLYPVAHSGSSYFVLSQGYSRGGIPEDSKDYIEHCRKAGAFRKTKVAVPTRAEASKDVAALRKSKAWTSIKWKDSGENWSYTLHEESAWEFIQKQAESIR